MDKLFFLQNFIEKRGKGSHLDSQQIVTVNATFWRVCITKRGVFKGCSSIYTNIV